MSCPKRKDEEDDRTARNEAIEDGLQRPNVHRKAQTDGRYDTIRRAKTAVKREKHTFPKSIKTVIMDLYERSSKGKEKKKRGKLTNNTPKTPTNAAPTSNPSSCAGARLDNVETRRLDEVIVESQI